MPNKIKICSGLLFLALAAFLAACSQTAVTISPVVSDAEVEAVEFQGQELTPLRYQRNNALSGTQHIDKASYRLRVDGLVVTPLSLSYADLQALPQTSKLNTLNCVEGWDFIAKWTGPKLEHIFQQAGVQPQAKIAIFYTTDVPEGYSSLEVGYILDKGILIALKINDITLPDERGFPFQVMAESKYGYKWAKWITRIELSSDINFRGYWEQAGYSNQADVGGPRFGD